MNGASDISIGVIIFDACRAIQKEKYTLEQVEVRNSTEL
jgi:hypothetical protein